MFYLIHVQSLKDGTNPNSTTAYEDKNAALSSYHSALASDYASESIEVAFCLVVNEIGGQIARDYVDKRVQPEPNEG